MTTQTPAPGTPQTGTKAWVAFVGSLVFIALTGVLQAWDGGITGQEWLQIALLVLGGSGITGVATYQTLNKPKAGTGL